MRLLLLILATVVAAEAAKTRRYCQGTKRPEHVHRKSLVCLKRQQAGKFNEMEAEKTNDQAEYIRKCFDDVGQGQCGSSADVLNENVFDSDTSTEIKGCFACQLIFAYLKENYFLNHGQRKCFNQVFLDEVTRRSLTCTAGRRIPLIDPDDEGAAAHGDALEASFAHGMGWRHFVDTCRNSGKTATADAIASCMAAEPRLPLYCRSVDFCYLGRFKSCPAPWPFVGRQAMASRKTMCSCFNGERTNLMQALKEMSDKVTAEAKSVGAGYTPEACQATALGILKKYTEGKGDSAWKVDWLNVFQRSVKECIVKDTSTNVNAQIVIWPCSSLGQEVADGVDMTQLQRTTSMISNFASSIMDRIVRFCRCDNDA